MISTTWTRDNFYNTLYPVVADDAFTVSLPSVLEAHFRNEWLCFEVMFHREQLQEFIKDGTVRVISDDTIVYENIDFTFMEWKLTTCNHDDLK